MRSLEDRLRADLTTAAEDVIVSGDAWQQNQRRIAAQVGQRRTRLLQTLSAAAAITLLAGGLAVAVSTRDLEDRQPTGPARDSQPTSTPTGLAGLPLGPGVKVDERVIYQNKTPASLMVSFEKAEGDANEHPLMCDALYERNKPTTISCGGLVAKSSDAGAVVDYLRAGRIGDQKSESDIRVLSGAVDDRVSVVTAYFPDGRSERLTLHELTGDGYRESGLEGYRVFGRIASGSADPAPQRLVATGKTGKVLQSLDLVQHAGEEWGMKAFRACAPNPIEPSGLPREGLVAYPPLPAEGGPGAISREFPLSVIVGTADVRYGADRSATDASGLVELCADLQPRAIAAGYGGPAHREPSDTGGLTSRGAVMAIVAPEVAYVELHDAGGAPLRVEPRTIAGSLWRVVMQDVENPSDAERVRIIAYDATGQRLDERQATSLNTEGRLLAPAS